VPYVTSTSVKWNQETSAWIIVIGLDIAELSSVEIAMASRVKSSTLRIEVNVKDLYETFYEVYSSTGNNTTVRQKMIEYIIRNTGRTMKKEWNVTSKHVLHELRNELYKI